MNVSFSVGHTMREPLLGTVAHLNQSPPSMPLMLAALQAVPSLRDERKSSRFLCWQLVSGAFACLRLGYWGGRVCITCHMRLSSQALLRSRRQTRSRQAFTQTGVFLVMTRQTLNSQQPKNITAGLVQIKAEAGEVVMFASSWTSARW